MAFFYQAQQLALAQQRVGQVQPVEFDLLRFVDAKLFDEQFFALFSRLLQAGLGSGQEELAKQMEKKDIYHGHRLMGLYYLLKNQPKEAIERLEKANQMKPLEPNVAIFLVRALAAEKRTKEAESLAIQLIGKHKELAPAYNFLYVSYVSSNRLNEAEAILKLRSANNPNDELALLQLAQFYAAGHREAEMRAAIVRGEKRFPQP